MKFFIYDAAMKLACVKNFRDRSPLLADEVWDCVKNHALIAAGTAWIPIQGAAIVLMAYNLWSMYVQINKKYHIRFSAVFSNTPSSIITLTTGGLFKFIPGMSLFSTALFSAIIYVTTQTVAWIYLRSLARFFVHEGGS